MAQSHDRLSELLERDLHAVRTTASPADLARARSLLPTTLPTVGLGYHETSDLLLNIIAPALAAGHAGPRYFGFVTGGATEISLLADRLASSFDNNVQVHLPNDTISTYIEHVSCNLVLDLLSIPTGTFESKTVTTGATSSNILGLALGREFAISQAKGPTYSVAEDGFHGVQVDVICAGAHASIKKAAAIVGIGRNRCVDFTIEASASGDDLVAFDLARLEKALEEGKRAGRGLIVCPAYGEVNTGAFTPNMPIIRQLCDKYGAWLHLDAAFGGFGALHPDFEDQIIQGMQMADSLTLDGHKWLNVPYDCGLFYTRKTAVHQAVCGPGANVPAYLATSTASSISSPLNVRLENSSRFRALPLYASLVSLGIQGYREIICRNIAFARRVEQWLQNHEYYDVLTPSVKGDKYKLLNIVLFAPRVNCPNQSLRSTEEGGTLLVQEVNASGEIFLSPTRWKGRSAARMAVSNHLTGLTERDFETVIARLDTVIKACSAVTKS